ncbi:hypothetical protein HPHPA14_0085 [Helicobacter pylori Hp A-14]|nr:hypothetical protein HPHPA14_0085 [Helicobacter pylori Hp A-14]
MFFPKLTLTAIIFLLNISCHYTREREVKGFDQKRLYFDWIKLSLDYNQALIFGLKNALSVL